MKSISSISSMPSSRPSPACWALFLALAWISPALAKTDGDAIIDPDARTQLITDWGYDIKQPGKAETLTPEFAQSLFVDDKMTCLRVPIWGDVKHPAHPADGEVVESGYQAVLNAMANARNARKDVVFFASKRLEAKQSFPDWVKDANGVVPGPYAHLLADYLKFMKDHGFAIDILGIDNEMEYNEGKITPEKHKAIIDELKSLAASRGFAMPKIIGPDGYGPKADWLTTLTESGWGDRLDMAGTHYYPKWRKPGKLEPWVKAAGDRPKWHTELHWDKVVAPNDILDTAEKAFAAFFDCTDSGLSGYVWWSYVRTGVKGELEQALTQSTAKTRPIDVDDVDGREIKYGTLITRAYREGDRIVVWAINNNAKKAYDSYGFRLANGAIDGDVAYRQWTNSESTAGQATKSGDNGFQLTLPAKTFTQITFELGE
ncbi:MAG: hypothetical protein NTW86_07255 [Candidatus Sumerlaeota bacterium]|nr:hypothetical protein [Candidatus Sumerlaeota bacterium]